MRIKVLAVVAVCLLPLMGCRYANPNTLWGTPKPCIITTTIFGPSEDTIAYSVDKVLDGSIATKALQTWADSAGLTSDQMASLKAVAVADRQTDKWIMKDEHVMDLWFQGWWRDEDDDEWKRIGIDND